MRALRTRRASSPCLSRAGWVVAAILLSTIVAGTGAAGATSESFVCETKPIVVKIHADWCGSCRATQPTWERVVAELSNRATMVRFDVTDRASYESAVAEAARLEIGDFLRAYRRRTGTIAVLDCETRQPLVVLSGERDFSKYREAIEEANPATR